jgi:hypothetical protein
MTPRSILHLRLAGSDSHPGWKPNRGRGAKFPTLADFCRRTTPVWELSSQGAFLDLTGTERLYGRGLDGAVQVSRMARDTGGALSAGAAPTKLAAELASMTAARAGGGVLAVVPEKVTVFLQPFPVDFLPERPSVIGRLRQLGVRTFGDLQVIPRSLLRSVFGSGGSRLAEEARGRGHGFSADAGGLAAGEAAALELVVGVKLNRPVTCGPLVSALLRGLAVRALTGYPAGLGSRGCWHLTTRGAEGTRDASFVRGDMPSGWTAWFGLLELLWKRLPYRRQGLVGIELHVEAGGPPTPCRQDSLFPPDEADRRLAKVLRRSRREHRLRLGPGSEELLASLGAKWYGPGAGISKPEPGFG